MEMEIKTNSPLLQQEYEVKRLKFRPLPKAGMAW
jgi:hypothetical protein